MRKSVLTLGMAIVFGLAAGQTVHTPTTGAPGTNSPYDYAYRLASQETVTGTIVGIGESKPNSNMPTSERLIVQSLGNKSSTYLVELGPQSYVSAQHAKPRLGQWVRVTGSKITDHGQTKILALQITFHNHDVLALRRTDGTPYWVDLTASNVPSQPNATPPIGTVLSQQTFNINGVNYPGYVVQTSNGPQNIVNMTDENSSYFVPQVQTYSVGNNIRVISGGYYPVVAVGGPFGPSPFVAPITPIGGSGVIQVGPRWW